MILDVPSAIMNETSGAPEDRCLTEDVASGGCDGTQAESRLL